MAPTEDASLSRMTIVTTGSDEVIEQITKHLNRLVEVVKVVDLTEGAHIERELMLVKVRAVGKEREEMKRTADIFRGRIIDVTEKTYTIELTGNGGKLRCVPRCHRPHRDPGNRPHGRLRHRPRRTHPEGLTGAPGSGHKPIAVSPAARRVNRNQRPRHAATPYTQTEKIEGIIMKVFYDKDADLS